MAAMMKMPVMMSTCSTYRSASHSGTDARKSEPGNGERAIHPIRSFCANSPVGLKIRMVMMRRKPMPSRKPEET